MFSNPEDRSWVETVLQTHPLVSQERNFPIENYRAWRNRGLSGGNLAGLNASNEFIALVNNDTRRIRICLDDHTAQLKTEP